MRTTKRATYGLDRKAQVPALDDTHAKLCPKCDHWFAAEKRARVCDGCRPASVRAKITADKFRKAATKAAADKLASPQVRAYEKSHPETLAEARKWDKRVADGMPRSEAWQLEREEMYKRLPVALRKSIERNIKLGIQGI